MIIMDYYYIWQEQYLDSEDEQRWWDKQNMSYQQWCKAWTDSIKKNSTTTKEDSAEVANDKKEN